MAVAALERSGVYLLLRVRLLSTSGRFELQNSATFNSKPPSPSGFVKPSTFSYLHLPTARRYTPCNSDVTKDTKPRCRSCLATLTFRVASTQPRAPFSSRIRLRSTSGYFPGSLSATFRVRIRLHSTSGLFLAFGFVYL